MSPDWIIGALAFVTIGLIIAVAVYHFGYFLKEPRNRGAVGNIAGGGKAATTRAHEDAPAGSYHDRPLKQRLDASSASAHPYDPKIDNRPLRS